MARPEIRLKESTNMPLALPGERRLIAQVAARAGGHGRGSHRSRAHASLGDEK
jgi:hypothetical protein